LTLDLSRLGHLASDAANKGYRGFARGSIAATITVNSGALIAVISQIGNIGGLRNFEL